MDHFKTTRTFYKNKVSPLLVYSTRSRLDILLDYVAAKNVLDLGCVDHQASQSEVKNWWLHDLIKNRASSLLGMDYDKEEVQKLKDKGYDICIGDAENFNLEKKFDVVMSGELFEHLTNHRSFLECVKNHLKDDGVWVASMPNANSLNYLMQVAVFNHEVDAWDHAAFFTPVTLSVMLKKCGMMPLKIILYQPSQIYNHTNKIHKTLAYVSNKIQQAICWLRPSLARGMIVVAKRINDESVPITD